MSGPDGRKSKAAENRNRPRIRDRERTRRNLLEAGLKVLHRDGFDTATIEDITKEAGVSRAAFYIYFADKRDIATEILDNLAEEDVAQVFRRLNDLDDGSWESVRAWVSDTASWYEGRRAVNIVSMSALAATPEFSAAWLHNDERLADSLTRYLAKHSEDRERARFRLVLLSEGLYLTLYLWKVGQVEIDEDRLLDAITDVYWAVLNDGKRPS